MCLFTTCPSENADWNQQQLTDGCILAKRNRANYPYCFLIQSERSPDFGFLACDLWRIIFVSCPPRKTKLQRWRERAWLLQARENHVDTILKKIASGNPSIIVCPCCLACHLLQPCPITFWHLLWCYEVPCLDMGGYQVETPHIGRYREYLLPPSPFKGALPKIIIIYLHQRTYGRGHREYKLTFRGIILILCYQVVTSSESW